MPCCMFIGGANKTPCDGELDVSMQHLFFQGCRGMGVLSVLGLQFPLRNNTCQDPAVVQRALNVSKQMVDLVNQALLFRSTSHPHNLGFRDG